MRKIISLVFLLAFISPPANAVTEAVLQQYLSVAPVKIGSGDYYWHGLFHAYHATLYSSGSEFDWNKPFALDMLYKRDIDGDDIAEQSISEMKRTGQIDDANSKVWEDRLKDIFPDVHDGSTITGVYLPGKGAIILDGDKKIGEINDLDFSRKFFSIWLGDKPFDRKLSAKLLGLVK